MLGANLNTMHALLRLGLVLLLATGTLLRAAATADAAAERVAIGALEAMNKGDGERFVTYAHPELMQQMRTKLIAFIEADVVRGKPSREMAALGVKTLDELKALPPEKFARVTVERMRDNLHPSMRDAMRTAQFSVLNSTQETPEIVRLAVGMELQVGGGARNESFEVRLKKQQGTWKFLGQKEGASSLGPTR